MRRSRTTAAVAAIGVALLLLGACSSSSSKAAGGSAPVKLSGTVTDKGTKAASGGSIAISVDDFYFEPTFITAKGGSTLKITLHNEGKQTHTFTSAALGVDKTLAPGATTAVTVTVPGSGSAQFHCTFHVSQGMQGAVVAT